MMMLKSEYRALEKALCPTGGDVSIGLNGHFGNCGIREAPAIFRQHTPTGSYNCDSSKHAALEVYVTSLLSRFTRSCLI